MADLLVDLNWRTGFPGVDTLRTVGWRQAETLDIGGLAELQKRLQSGVHLRVSVGFNLKFTTTYPIGGWRSVMKKKAKLH